MPLGNIVKMTLTSALWHAEQFELNGLSVRKLFIAQV